MRTKTIAIVAAILAVGVVLTAMILRSDPRGVSGEAAAAPVPGALDYPRGPHGARLLSDDGLRLEMTIYETGVPPQFRVYPYDAEGNPIPPRDVMLRVDLHRLGGRVDPITFTPEADYLVGQAVVEEPHSFDVKVNAQHKGRTHQFAYAQIEGKVQLGADQLKSAGVEIARAGPREMLTTFELPGEIKLDATREAHVVPRVQGVVTAVTKREGDAVRRGEVMAVLSSRELADAKSSYIESQHQVEFTKVALAREEVLHQKKISAEQEYLAAVKVAEEAELAQDVAAQKLIALGVPAASLSGIAGAPRDSLSRFEVRAPLDGTVTARNITIGEAVTADENIFTVSDLSSVWADVTVFAKDLGAVHEGQEATVMSADLGIEGTGRIQYVGPLVGEETRSATARIVLPNPGRRWRPGLYVTVRLVRNSATVPIAVRAEGIQTFRDWQVVFVKYGDWFEGRPLELGRTDGEYVEVLAGLAPGDEYAAANSFAVKAEIGKLGATHDH